MDDQEALFLVAALLEKQRMAAEQGLDEERAESLETTIQLVSEQVMFVSPVFYEAWKMGVNSEHKTLTKDADGNIISKGT